MTKEEKTLYFIERANKIHNNKYDYSLTQYIYAKDKVVIKCDEHGIFEQTAINHLKGHGCKVCGKIKERKSVNENKLRKKFQNIIQPEDYKIIPISNDEVVFVDNCDFDKVKDINWHNNGSGYARNDKFGYMHRFILGVEGDLQVDHKDRNTFNNKRENIRIVSSMENNWNTSSIKNSSSIYKGVQKLPSGNWTAIIVSNSVKNYIGTFSNEVEAAKAVDRASLKERGEFAYLNFPELKDEYLKSIK